MLYYDQSALLGGGAQGGGGGKHILRGVGATPTPPSRHAPGLLDME